MHGSPWLRASEATRVRRRRQNVEVGHRQNVEGRFGDSGVLIDVLSGEFVFNNLNLLRLKHNLAHNPPEVSRREAGILRMHGYMLGKGLLLRRRQPAGLMCGCSLRSTFSGQRLGIPWSFQVVAVIGGFCRMSR